MIFPVVFPDHEMFIFVNSPMKVAASVTNIICITQITFEFIYYTLLVYQGWLFFRNSMISDLFACANRISLYGIIIRTGLSDGVVTWSGGCWRRLIAESISFPGYSSFKNILFKFLHSCKRKSCVDDKRFARLYLFPSVFFL